MNKNYTNNRYVMIRILPKIVVFLIVLAVTGTTYQAYSQNVINVPQGFGTLNDAVAAAEAGDIFELERDGIYLLNGSVRNSVPITIRAAEGEGARPFLQPAVLEGGETVQPLRADADMTLIGLRITNEDELGVIATRIIRVSTSDVKLRVEDCRIDQDGQTMVRLDAGNAKVYLYENIISNMGQTTSLPNGRVVDDRGNDVDTLIIHNNTMYNITSMVLRNGGTGTINYAEISQNTIVNVGHQTADFGSALTVVFKNNIVADFNFIGYNPSGFGNIRDNTIDVLPYDGDQTILISNNNFYMNQELTDAYPDSIIIAPIFSESTIELVGAEVLDENNFEEVISFNNGVGPATSVVTEYYAGASTLPLMPQVSEDDMDFAYGTTAASYTASTSGQPLGDLRWFGIPVNISRDHTYQPAGFALIGNYPNPFNPSTNIVFDLDRPINVTMEIVTILGQVVDRIPLGEMGTGRHVHTYNAGNLSSGIYMIRMQAGNSVQIHKMTFIK